MTHPAVTDWLNAAQARAVAATPGPWWLDGRGSLLAPPTEQNPTPTTREGEPLYDGAVVCETVQGADAAFLLGTRTDLPRLIEAVRTVLDLADELAQRPATASALTTAARLQDAVYTALFPAPEATDA